jgi:lipid II:glycine glycyltransferase (peptidoglycan interpeptide bridge formation enzyme)
MIGSRNVDAGYSWEADTVDEVQWCRILEEFEDANIYQTWSYGEVRFGRRNMSHFLLKEKGEIVAVAQVRIARIPLVKAGIAYVRWGPLWRRRGRTPQSETFRQAIRALRNEYASKRGLVVRVYPQLFDDEAGGWARVLEDEGYREAKEGKRDRTLLLDVRGPLESIRRSLRPHWSRYLKVAERSGLEIVQGSDDELFGTFVQIYKEMVSRKGFVEPNDINEFRMIQERLPSHLKMKVLLGRANGEVCAGLVCGAMGNRATYLFGATSDAGLQKRGAYLLHWKVIEWLKATGIETYDLNGIDPVANPGTYRFKADFCGSGGRDVHFLGRFDVYGSGLSHVAVVWGDVLRTRARSLRKRLTDRTRRARVGAGDGSEGAGAPRGPSPAKQGRVQC